MLSPVLPFSPLQRGVLALATAAGCIVTAGACSSDRTTPTAPPVPGALTLTFAAPADAGAAVRIEVTGADSILSVTNLSKLAMYTRSTGHTTAVALFGSLAPGDLLSLGIPDVAHASSYSARVVEVADTSNALQTDTAAYSVTLRGQ